MRAVLLVLLGSALLTLSAKLKVPFYPVPMTMQPFAVLLIGLAFGARLGLATVALYLAEGALGLPVFAGTPERGIGLAYMLGPTGGYLLGYLLAVALTGWIAERRRDAAGLALAVAAGYLAIYIPGLLWLAKFVGFEAVLGSGWRRSSGAICSRRRWRGRWRWAAPPWCAGGSRSEQDQRWSSGSGPAPATSSRRRRRCAEDDWSPFLPRPYMAWAPSRPTTARLPPSSPRRNGPASIR